MEPRWEDIEGIIDSEIDAHKGMVDEFPEMDTEYKRGFIAGLEHIYALLRLWKEREEE